VRTRQTRGAAHRDASRSSPDLRRDEPLRPNRRRVSVFRCASNPTWHRVQSRRQRRGGDEHLKPRVAWDHTPRAVDTASREDGKTRAWRWGTVGGVSRSFSARERWRGWETVTRQDRFVCFHPQCLRVQYRVHICDRLILPAAGFGAGQKPR